MFTEQKRVVNESQTIQRKELAVILPVHNEEDNLEPLHQEISTVLSALGRSYQVIYVNDGSRDDSIDKLQQIARDDPHVFVVDFRRNFGQAPALAAGIDFANADYMVFMDADLQNDPTDIPRMLEKLEVENLDMVSGWRRNRKDKLATRRIPSIIANQLISIVTGVLLHDYGCTLKIYRSDVLEDVRLYGEMHRFIPVFVSAVGAKIGEIEVNHRPRIHGTSKYTLWRTVKVILDLITVKFLLNYRTTPMYLFGGFGMIVILLSLIFLLVAIFRKILLGASLSRTPLPLLSATLLILGIQSILMGLVAELLVRTYYESQNKPIYTVRRILGADHQEYS